MDEAIVETRLRKDEARKTVPYLDTLKNWTGGIGHKMTAMQAIQYAAGISDAQIETWFDSDFDSAVTAASEYPWFSRLDAARQQIIVCLEFNLGPRKFAGFHETQAFIASGDFTSAATALLDSRWAQEVHCDTPESRGQTYARILRTGNWE